MTAAANRMMREFYQAEEASDDAFFDACGGCQYRARLATADEIKVVQTFEDRLHDIDKGCVALALIRRVDGCRRRVIVEAEGFDPEAMDEGTIAAVFDLVVANGWLAIERRAS